MSELAFFPRACTVPFLLLWREATRLLPDASRVCLGLAASRATNQVSLWCVCVCLFVLYKVPRPGYSVAEAQKELRQNLNHGTAFLFLGPDLASPHSLPTAVQ